MTKHILAWLMIILASASCHAKIKKKAHTHNPMHSAIQYLRPLPQIQPFILNHDSITPWVAPADLMLLLHAERLSRAPLGEKDYEEVAAQLGVEPAALHAVVEIETGAKHSGFWGDHKPVTYFSLAKFRNYARDRGVNLKSYRKSHPAVFASGRGITATIERVRQAMEIDSVAAIKACYWGMFQIGGFNWRLCGAESPQDFHTKMSHSERSQLNLFIEFLRSTNLIEPLRRKDWRAFARGYNGPSYARRGYHTRMARAYKKYASKQ